MSELTFKCSGNCFIQESLAERQCIYIVLCSRYTLNDSTDGQWKEEITVFPQSDSHSLSVPLERWFPIFPMLRPFNTVPHAVLTPNHNVIPLLLHSCNIAIVMNYNENIGYVTPIKGLFEPPKGSQPTGVTSSFPE